MTFYFIVLGKSAGLTPEQTKNLEKLGTIVTITHKGKLSDLRQLQNDTGDKILAVDPDVFDWDLEIEAVKQLKNVKAVCPQSTAFDWVHPKELKALGIPVSNCPHFPAESVAEYVVALTIEGLRKTALHLKNKWEMNWDARGSSLRGKTVGVIGLGAIGHGIATNMHAMGANVIYWSKHTKDKNFKYVSVDELFRTSDVIIPAMATNDGSKKVITNTHLDSMKKTALFVGLNRIVKELLDEEYLFKKVEKGEIGGYAFESDFAKDVTHYKGNIWSVPAIAWYTDDSVANLLDIWVNNMIAVAKDTPQNVVN